MERDIFRHRNSSVARNKKKKKEPPGAVPGEVNINNNLLGIGRGAKPSLRISWNLAL
jgi:hypothetical protein